MVRSDWVTRWARCRACGAGEPSAGGCSVAAALRAPTGATGFRPGVRETASAQVGLVLGLRAEWKAGDGKHRGEGGDGFHPPVGVIALLLNTAGDDVLLVHVRFLRPS